MLAVWRAPFTAFRISFCRIICCVAVLLLTAPVAVVSAQDSFGYDSTAPYDPIHRSELKVPPGGPYPVRRKVTIGLDKSMLVEVPTVLQNVLVSNPDVVDAVVQTSQQVYLLGKFVGEANVHFMGPDGRKILYLEVTVARDVTTLSDTLRRLLPGSSINVEMMGDTVVLTGVVVSPIDANRAAELASKFVKKKDGVVSMLNTETKEQVILKVQVAEIQRDALRRIGVDLPGSLLSSGNFTFAKVLQNAFPVTSSVVAAATAIAPATAPLVAAGSAFHTTWQSGGQRVQALLQALERRGALKLLAEPTLTAISGETASFLAGGEFPIPIAEEDNRITVDYKEFGIKIAFKPVVLTGGRISLHISAEVSELSSDGAVTLNSITLPALRVRRAETTLELPSGGTLAMAGLLSDETRQSVEGVPGLKNLPVLGALFRSNDFRRRETELVILVTPYLASHAATAALARPTDGFMPESELKELFFGHINRIYGGEVGAGFGEFNGDYGYVIDYPGVKG